MFFKSFFKKSQWSPASLCFRKDEDLLVSESEVEDERSYLHDDEEDEGNKNVDMRMFPHFDGADVVKLISHTLLGPGPVIQQSHQGLVLGQLSEREVRQEVRTQTTFPTMQHSRHHHVPSP